MWGTYTHLLLQMRQQDPKFVLSLDYHSKRLSQNQIEKRWRCSSETEGLLSRRGLVDAISSIAKRGREVEKSIF